MSALITSKNYDGKTLTLVDEKTGAPISEGDVRTSRREQYVITGGRAPHKPESTGRVWCRLAPFSNFAQSMQDAKDGETPYTPEAIASCWDDLSSSERAEWASDHTLEFFPGVLEAKWVADFPHPEAPETISRINKARRAARRAVIAKR